MSLADSKVMAMVAVKDVAAGKAFYGEKLGLKEAEENDGGVAYECGGGTLFMYNAPASAGTGQATAASWYVDDMDATVAELKSKGISFESYDIPGATKEGDIYVIGPMKAAWFKDPDGNILGLANGQ